MYKDITPGTAQTINIVLTEDRKTLNEVVIKSGKKTRYTNKNNPAVELIRKVIAHKDQNRIQMLLAVKTCCQSIWKKNYQITIIANHPL